MVYIESCFYQLQQLNDNQAETIFFIFIVNMRTAEQLETIFVVTFFEKPTYNQTLVKD